MTPAAPTQRMDIESRGHGPARLVALHGIQGTRASWSAVADALAPDCRTLLPNLRGRGAAWRGHSPRDYTLDTFAGDVQAAVTQAMGDVPYVLAGWSMGVSVALQYVTAVHRSGGALPQGLVLLSGSPWLADTRWFSAEGEALRAEVAARERRLALREAADLDAVAWTWQAIGRTDQRALLASIVLPTLVLHGSDDEDSPVQHGRWLAEGIAGAQLQVLPGAGHSLLTQNTDTVVQALRSFMREHATIPTKTPA